MLKIKDLPDRAVNKVTLHTVDPVTSTTWAQLVSGTASTLFHSPQWMRVIQETYGLPLAAYVLQQEEEPIAGVPWCQVNDFLGRRRVTLAYSDFCDILAPTRKESRTLAEFIAMDGHPWTLRTLARNLPDVSVPVSRNALFKWQGIDLDADQQVLWERLSSMAQRGVGKAERSGVEVRQADSKEELREWFLLHLRLRKAKFGLLAQPYAFFENIWDIFIETGKGFLLIGRYQDKIVGGTLYLLWKDTCYYKFNTSDMASLALRPNNLLLWRGMLEAKARGCHFLDLGRSPVKQEGLMAFKRGFGAIEEDLYSLTYQTSNGDNADAQARGLLESLTHLFVKDCVPDSVTEQAGTLLYRFFV